MNILALSTRSPYPLISGHSLRTYHILKGAANRHNVTLVTFVQLEEELERDNLGHLESLFHAVYPFRVPVDMSRVKLITSLFSNLFSPLPFVAQKYNAYEVRQKLRGIIAENGIDLVHVDMLPLSVYVDEFGQLPRLLVNHNVESVRLYRWFQTELNPIKKIYLGIQFFKLRSFERRVVGKFDCCVVVSETDKHLLEKMGIYNELYVVPNGTDTNFFRPLGKNTNKNLVLWIGHMDVHTNKDAVLYFWQDIYPLLREKHPPTEIKFVGTAPPSIISDAAEKFAEIKVTGFVDDVRPHVDEAAVIVVPIRIGSGTRIKILDAMAMGKAIVSTSIGCEGLEVTPGTDILVADTPRDFADKIIQVLKNKGLRMKLEKSARAFAQGQDWNIMARKQEAIYQHIIRRPSS
jgi:glycosyltransferase involved in cell wall biosynthesis